MRSVKSLLLVFITFGLFSCSPIGPNSTKIGDEKTSGCGEVPAGVTMDKRALDLAGAAIGDFSLGKLEVKDEPRFEKIISEAASNVAVTDVLVCKAIARAGVKGNPEMVDYFTRLTHFLARQPSISDQLQWRQANPFPKASGQGPSILNNNGIADFSLTGEGAHPDVGALASARLARMCTQSITGLKRPPEIFLHEWRSVANRLRKERLPAEHDLLNLYSLKARLRHEPSDPRDLFLEALFTLKCLEDIGELQLKKTDLEKTYWGVNFKNHLIIFRNL
jgi:hypothetical protein